MVLYRPAFDSLEKIVKMKIFYKPLRRKGDKIDALEGGVP